jgi:hypothetical protein
LDQLYNDIRDLFNQTSDFVKSVPSEFSACKSQSLLQVLQQLSCYTEVGNTGLSRGLLYISSLAYDLSQYKTELQEAAEQIVKCGAAEVGESLKKYGDILQSVQTCVLTEQSTE